MIVDLKEYGPNPDSIWYGDQRNSYTYDGDGNRLTWKVEDYMSGWIGEYFYTYVYNEYGRLIFQKEDLWDFPDSSWKNYHRYFYDYDIEGNLLNELIELSTNNVWEFDKLNTYSYDENNNLSSVLFQYWRESINDWENNILTLIPTPEDLELEDIPAGQDTIARGNDIFKSYEFVNA